MNQSHFSNNSEITADPQVLVTRPAHQSAQFIDQLKKAGLATMSLPTIEIKHLQTDLQKALDSDLVIFTSVNAVAGAHNNIPLPWKTKARIAAIGKATAGSLRKSKTQVDLVPTIGASSEALLEQTGNVQGLNIAIIRGNSGRDKLYKTLTARGAQVEYYAVYERQQPVYTDDQINRIFNNTLPDIISVTSDLGLTNLLDIVPPQIKTELLQRPLVVNSARCAAAATELGFTGPVSVASPPGNESQVTIISHYARSQRQNN